MKKLLAILLAVAMIMGLALTASAKETTLADVDSPAFWGAHSEGIEVTETQTTVTFHAKTYDNVEIFNVDGLVQGWLSPNVVVYTGSEAKVNGADYYEYGVIRADNFSWGTNGTTVTGGGNSPADWEAWLRGNIVGVDCTVTAQIVDGDAVINITVNDLSNTYTVDVTDGSKVYISLSGEAVQLTNIKVTTPDPVVEPTVPAEDTVTEIYGSSDATTGWAQLGQVNTTIWGGELDPSFLAEGGYLSVNFSIEDISQLWQVRVMLNGTQWTEIDWHVDPSSVTNPAGTLNDLGNGNYSVTFTYDEIVAAYGAADFATTLGAIDIATNGGAPITVTGVTYTVPAPEADPENPKAGDSIAVIFALLAVSAAGIAVVSKKKEF